MDRPLAGSNPTGGEIRRSLMADAPTEEPAPVRFGLADAMILIAGIAFGLSWLRVELGKEWAFIQSGGPGSGFSPVLLAVIRAETVQETTIPIAAGLTLGLALVQIRRARDRPGRRVLRPGMVGCLTPGPAILAYLAWCGTNAAMTRDIDLGLPVGFYFVAEGPRVIGGPIVTMAEVAGFAVAGAWLVSWVGNIPPVRGAGVDLAGRVLGWYWLASIPIHGPINILITLVLQNRL